MSCNLRDELTNLEREMVLLYTSTEVTETVKPLAYIVRLRCTRMLAALDVEPAHTEPPNPTEPAQTEPGRQPRVSASLIHELREYHHHPERQTNTVRTQIICQLIFELVVQGIEL